MTVKRSSQGRGRRAVLVDESAIPDPVGPSGLHVTVHDEYGNSATYSLESSPGSMRLRQQFARAISVANGPYGTWRSIKRFESRLYRLDRFLIWANSVALEDLDDLTPELWEAWIDHLDVSHPALTADTRNTYLGIPKVLVLHHDGLTEAARDAVRRKYCETPGDAEVPSYTKAQFSRGRRAAIRKIREAADRIEPNWQIAALPRHDTPVPYSLDLWDGLNAVLNGDLPSEPAQWLAMGATRKSKHGLRLSKTAARRSLFLDGNECVAAIAAMICVTGETLSMMAEYSVPTTAATAGNPNATVLQARTIKPRRGAGRHHKTTNAGTKGAVGYVFGLVAAATEPGREAARRQGLAVADKLIVGFSKTGGYLDGPSIDQAGGRIPYARRNSNWWPDTNPPLTFATLHRTYVTQIARRPVAQLPRTRTQAYLASDPKTREKWAQTAQNAIRSLFDGARERMSIALLSHEQADAAGLLDGGPSSYLTPTGIGCVDCLHHPETDKPCEEPFLACLGCKNAFAVDDHLPMLVCTLDLLNRLAQSIDEETWDSRYRLAWARLTVLLEGLSTGEWQQAREAVTEGMVHDIADVLVGRAYEVFR